MEHDFRRVLLHVKEKESIKNVFQWFVFYHNDTVNVFELKTIIILIKWQRLCNMNIKSYIITTINAFLQMKNQYITCMHQYTDWSIIFNEINIINLVQECISISDIKHIKIAVRIDIIEYRWLVKLFYA